MVFFLQSLRTHHSLRLDDIVIFSHCMTGRMIPIGDYEEVITF